MYLANPVNILNDEMSPKQENIIRIQELTDMYVTGT